MPPLVKYNKEKIIDCAYEIAKKEGMSKINARGIASVLGCSVQPIFHHFSSMEELKEEVYKKIYEKYLEYMNSGKNLEKPYKQMGISYIKFAKEYPEFFKIIFMQKTKLDAKEFIMADNVGDDVIKKGQELTGFSYEDQKEFHVKVWVFTHGIASLVATNTIRISDKEIDTLLETSVRQLAIGFKKERDI